MWPRAQYEAEVSLSDDERDALDMQRLRGAALCACLVREAASALPKMSLSAEWLFVWAKIRTGIGQGKMGLDALTTLCRAHGLPDPVREWRFAAPRRWRFDYAFVPAKVAVEIEGGVWIRGRHTRGKGFLADLEKYNRAACDGWIVLRFTPQQVKTGECLPVIRCALERYWPNRPWTNEGDKP